MSIQTYRAFLTLENVYNFIIYVIENNLIHDDRYRAFFTFIANNGHRVTMQNTNKYMCLQNCHGCLDIIPDWVGASLCCPCMRMCVERELNRMMTPKTFTILFRDILYHYDYREMLSNYLPYVDYQIKTWICGIQ